MSLEAMTWALNADVGDPTRKLALVGWANHAHKDGRNAWASHATIAEYVGCSTKTIGRHVKALLEEGWIREGDQSQVAHLRRDRRPIVYDLAMTEAQRREWAALYAGATAGERGHILSTRDAATGGQNVAPSEGHGGTSGGTDGGTSGGTPMSYEPKEPRNQEPPNPPHGGGRTSAATIDQQPAAGCRRHRTPADNCRGCGTTNRQIQARAAAAAAEQRRAAEDARFAAEGGAVRPNPAAVPLPPELKAQARNQIRANRDRKAAS